LHGTARNLRLPLSGFAGSDSMADRRYRRRAHGCGHRHATAAPPWGPMRLYA